MIGFDQDISRVKDDQLFYQARQNFLHIDDGREPEPELENNTNYLLQVTYKDIQGGGKESDTKGKKLLQVVYIW